MLLEFLRFLIEEKIYSFEVLRLTAKTENLASQRVAIKNGFVQEGPEIIEWGAPTFDFRINLTKQSQAE
jgi:RimJ/RimL family protein N-acetyltransferase